MMFDRFDIAEAYARYFYDWHSGGLTERDRATFASRRPRSINAQLTVMGAQLRDSIFQGDAEDALTENGAAIYAELVAKWEGR